MGKRRRARELALQFLYQYDTLTESSPEDMSIEETLNLFWATKETPLEDDVREFSYMLITGVRDNIERIDEIDRL